MRARARACARAWRAAQQKKTYLTHLLHRTIDITRQNLYDVSHIAFFWRTLAMYAIIETGGKQYRVSEGDLVDVELLEGAEKEVRFDQVLFLNDGKDLKVGAPHLKCVVHGELVEQVKGPKVIAFKYKRRENQRKKVGHRQKYCRVKITRIEA